MTMAEKLTTIAQNQQQVYEAGKAAAGGFDWDAFQENGNRTSYEYAFCRSWTDANYAPKYPITGKVPQCFSMSKITNTKVPIVASGAMTGTFQESEIVTIPRLDISAATAVTNTFYGAKRLTKVIFVGVIRANNLDLSSCPNVTKQSLLSLLNCLEDKTKSSSTVQWMVNLGSVNKEKLTAAELAIAEAKGWRVK